MKTTDPVVTIVSGLPRSGTSLMMQMLQAGGMMLLSDGRRVPDEHNPCGYFEHESVKHSHRDLSWLTQAEGKAVKVIHLLLRQLPSDRNYQVIFMLRDLDEVVASQRVMLQQQGLSPARLTDADLARVFAQQLDQVGHWLREQPNFRVLYVHYQDVIGHPAVAAKQINHFLGGNLRAASMAGAVNPSLHRQRQGASGPRASSCVAGTAPGF
jgi:hypothetical protein